MTHEPVTTKTAATHPALGEAVAPFSSQSGVETWRSRPKMCTERERTWAPCYTTETVDVIVPWVSWCLDLFEWGSFRCEWIYSSFSTPSPSPLLQTKKNKTTSLPSSVTTDGFLLLEDKHMIKRQLCSRPLSWENQLLSNGKLALAYLYFAHSYTDSCPPEVKLPHSIKTTYILVLGLMTSSLALLYRKQAKQSLANLVAVATHHFWGYWRHSSSSQTIRPRTHNLQRRTENIQST